MNQKLAVRMSLVALLVAVSGMTVSPISAQLELLPGIPELPILSSMVTLSVESADMDGNAFEGMWVVLSQDGVVLQAGFTPFSAELEADSEYQVSINDGTAENSSFVAWEDGSTDATRTFTIFEDTTFTAFFQIESAPAEQTMSTLTVESADMDGNPIEGMWVELWQDSVIIDEGFTPFSASVENGVTYQVSINDGTEENSSFSHWEDGSTDPMRTITLAEDTTLTAFFQT